MTLPAGHARFSIGNENARSVVDTTAMIQLLMKTMADDEGAGQGKTQECWKRDLLYPRKERVSPLVLYEIREVSRLREACGMVVWRGTTRRTCIVRRKHSLFLRAAMNVTEQGRTVSVAHEAFGAHVCAFSFVIG